MARAAEELLGEHISGGLVVTKDGHEAPLECLETLIASHPEPDERGVKAARRIAELVAPLGEGDLLLALISGGASALLADPAPPIGLEDLKLLTAALLRSGASIDEINAVRKHVSTLKDGGLALLASPAQTIALLLSDVVGDDPSSIASGLTAPDPTTLREIVERYSLELPASVEKHLGGATETPKADDGGDGSTEAAGALVDGKTARAIRKSGLEPAEALRNNDAYAALKAAGALLVTGPTGTNVNDLRVTLVSGLEQR